LKQNSKNNEVERLRWQVSVLSKQLAEYELALKDISLLVIQFNEDYANGKISTRAVAMELLEGILEILDA
jgi:hypothetical protein